VLINQAVLRGGATKLAIVFALVPAFGVVVFILVLAVKLELVVGADPGVHYLRQEVVLQWRLASGSLKLYALFINKS
jgi:hypothetical protein